MTYAVVEFETDDLVFQQGESGDCMYLVKEGEVEVLQDLGGKENQVAVLERGDFFGEMAILEEAPRTHSVRALSPAKLVRIDRPGFEVMLLRNAEIAVRMIRKLGRRLQSTEDMLMRAFAGAASDAERAPEMVAGDARLDFLNGERSWPLAVKPVITIGRSDPINGIRPDLDLTPVDQDFTTSRRHARLLRRADGFYIQEEQATNGTYVNGQRISTQTPLQIRSGDNVMFGAVRMRFMVGG